MKKIKLAALTLVMVLTVGLLGGCGLSFDASAYIKALLDNSYKNDSTEFLAQKIGTAEEASKLYEEGIDTELEALLAGVELSEELEAEYRQVLKDMFGAVKYTVGEAEKQDDGSYVVTVNYQQMQVFASAMAAYETEVTELMTQWTEDESSVPSDEEMLEQIYASLKDCLKDAVAGATYADEASTTIRVELADNVYSPNEDDVLNLETLLFDLNAAY
ncbi:MAG: hypothetical protein ACI4AD_03640 [Roseburia sp.]